MDCEKEDPASKRVQINTTAMEILFIVFGFSVLQSSCFPGEYVLNIEFTQ